MFHVRTKNVYWILKISRHVLIKPMKNNKQRKKKSIEKPEKMKQKRPIPQKTEEETKKKLVRKKKEKQIEEKTSETVKTKETKNKMLEKISEETEKRKRKNPEITNPAKELSERYCDAANEKISKYGPPSCYRSINEIRCKVLTLLM